MRILEEDSEKYYCPLCFAAGRGNIDPVCSGSKCAWWEWEDLKEYDEEAKEFYNKYGFFGGCR